MYFSQILSSSILPRDNHDPYLCDNHFLAFLNSVITYVSINKNIV